MAFELPPLPYDYSALQPYMSAQTLQFHHDKHHQAYVTKLNELVAGSELEGKGLEEVVKASFGKAEKQGVFNNAGQHWNHILFWEWMAPQGSRAIPPELEKRLVADFGSVENFKKEFTAGGVAQFGSGWVWLVEDGGKLSIMKTPNAENPLAHGKNTLLGCDVWEHSYYLDYQNRRPDYLNAFLDHLVNWETVAVRLQEK